MSAERDLARLLARMKPALDPHDYAFVTQPAGASLPPDVTALMQFQEDEGRTLILRRQEAERHGLAHTFPCRRITLTVHSALQAVGFLAAVATALARARISCNPVAGYHHDHLFVPAGRAEDAIRVLEALAQDPDFD